MKNKLRHLNRAVICMSGHAEFVADLGSPESEVAKGMRYIATIHDAETARQEQAAEDVIFFMSRQQAVKCVNAWALITGYADKAVAGERA